MAFVLQFASWQDDGTGTFVPVCCKSCCDGPGSQRSGPCAPCYDPSLGGDCAECEKGLAYWECEATTTTTTESP